MDKNREKIIMIIAGVVIAVMLVGGLAALFYFFFAAPTIGTVITPMPPTKTMIVSQTTEPVADVKTETQSSDDAAESENSSTATPTETPGLEVTAVSPTILLYQQRGRLFHFDLDSLTTEPFNLPAQSDVSEAQLDGDGRYLAYSDQTGLNLFDSVNGNSQLWLPGSTEPWTQFRPRAWSRAGNLLVQHIWGTEGSAPGWTQIDDQTWHPLPLPDGVTAEFYTFDSGATWSPDGTRLALGGYDYAIPSSVPGLTVINLETNTAQRIVTRMIASGIEDGDSLVAGVNDPAWSPDGAWIAFALEEDAVGPLDFPVRLYLVRPDGADLTPITNNELGRVAHPVWEDDGNLYYSLTGAGEAEDGIRAYNLAAQSDTLLIPGADLAPINLSPDGQFLVYRQTRREDGLVYQDLQVWFVETGQTLLIAAGQDGDPARFVGWLSSPPPR